MSERIAREEFVTRLIEKIMRLQQEVSSLHGILKAVEMYESQGCIVRFYIDEKSGSIYYEKESKKPMGFQN